MDGFQMVENIDQLWFFSSVLSSRKLDFYGGLVQEEELSKPTNQSEEKDQKIESPTAGIPPQRCPRCGEFTIEAEVPVGEAGGGTEMAKSESEKPQKRSRSRRRRRRRRARTNRSKGSFFQERNDFGLEEFDLGFDKESKFGSSWFYNYHINDERKSGSGLYPNYQNHVNMMMKMPPLDDGMAMKEHLKSWAYAVACTVR